MAPTLAKAVWRASITVSAVVAAVVPAALAPAAASADEPTCADLLLTDWQDGRLDGVYTVECYREALDALPEDVRAYSTAEADITRALRETLRRNVARPAGAPARSTPIQPSRRMSGANPRKASGAGGRATVNRTRALEPASTVLRSPPLPLLVAAALGLALCVAGTGGLVVQRVRVRRLAGQGMLRRRPHAIR